MNKMAQMDVREYFMQRYVFCFILKALKNEPPRAEKIFRTVERFELSRRTEAMQARARAPHSVSEWGN